jgi:hypothetical protein
MNSENEKYNYVQTLNRRNPQKPFDIPTKLLDRLESIFQEYSQKRQDLPGIISKRFPKISVEYNKWNTMLNIINHKKPPKKFKNYLDAEEQLITDRNNQLAIDLEPFLMSNSNEVLYDCKVTDVEIHNLTGYVRVGHNNIDTFREHTFLEVECKSAPELKEIDFYGGAPTAEIGTEIRVHIPPTIFIKDIMTDYTPSKVKEVLKNRYLNVEPRPSETANAIQILRDGNPVMSYVSNNPRIPNMFAAKD